MRRALFAAMIAAVLAACSGAAADHEVLGDRAYAQRSYRDALVEYRLAIRQGASAELRAKAGAAALHAGDLADAVQQFMALAQNDAKRTTEAAEGLELVARAAVDTNDHAAARAAINALRAIAPDRVVGGIGEELGFALGDSTLNRSALTLLPYAAAAAPDARRQDSLMYVYGTLLAATGRCQDALPIFESLVRRQREPTALAGAQRAGASCALQLGRQALAAGQPSQAETWFRQAATDAESTPEGRAAYVGLGDVMFAQGDFQGAAEAYQRAMLNAPPGDSIAAIAADHLNRLAQPGTPLP